MKTRTKPSPYPPLPFHAIRAMSFISSAIVTAILIYFSNLLYSEKFRIPWTFIIVILASLLNLLALLITSVVHCCATLSPVLNLIFNVPILLLWLLGFSLLSWNMYGTLGHSCSISNWATNEGVHICQTYKALYAFVFLGTLSHVAQVVLDARARHQQVRLGAYGKMRESQDIKIDNLRPLPQNTVHDTPFSGTEQFRDEVPGWRPGQQSNTTTSYGHSDSSVNMNDFGYQRPEQQTQYDSGHYAAGGYNHGGGYGYQDNNGRY